MKLKIGDTVKVISGNDKGKFGRILGIPLVEGRNICDQLVEEGHARSYFGFGPKEIWV